MNTRHAKKAFNELNAKYFFGVLPMPQFKKCNGNGHGLGSVYGYYNHNTIYYHRKLKGLMFRSTIAHEMGHHFQSTFNFWTDEEGHGQEFFNVTALMQKDGLKI